MAAINRLSENFYDIDKIAMDLTADIPPGFTENALAFLVCDSLVDCTELLNILGEKLNCPIIGGSTFTYPISEKVGQVSAALTLLSLKGLEYGISVTPPLDEEKSKEQVENAYKECLLALNSPPKLIMPFIPLIPGLTNDLFIHDLFEFAGSVPVFGGVTTDDLDTSKAAVYANGKVHGSSMLLAVFGGDIKPAFGVGSRLTVLSEYGPAVRESEKNIVKRVDDMTFCEYMRSIGISPEDRVNGIDALVQYGPLPCRLRHKLVDDDGVPEIRCISYTNVEEGSVAFSSELPVGTRVNMGIIQKNDVMESLQSCIGNLKAEMKKNEDEGYEYSMIFAVPCVARYFAMLGGENIESAYIRKELPEKMGLSIYYGFCEIGPTRGAKGEIHNRSHNASVVMCAI